MTTTSRFPGFEYAPNQLSKFLAASEFFTIILTDGSIIHFTPSDENLFRDWLLQHNITDVRTEKGWVIIQ